MSKIASYLSNHLHGEVLNSASIRQRFSRDGSILKITPLLVTFPFNTNDVRKIAHFAWQLAEKGHGLPLIPRGSGSNNVGAAIGSGVVMSLPFHLNKILEIDTKQKLVRLQPGVSMRSLQRAMETHGLDWPIDSHNPSSTIGGAIANNLYGHRGGLYGDVSSWVDQLELVLANGDTIQTKRLSKRELNKKKGLAGMEGEIYRQVDNLISDHQDIVDDLASRSNNAGYGLARVKDKKGGFDLSPLLVGSQGTLGVITEAIVRLDTHHPRKEVIAAGLSSVDDLEQLLVSLHKFNPARIEFIDQATLSYATQKMGLALTDLFPEDEDITKLAGLIIIEINDAHPLRSKAKKIIKLLQKSDHLITRSNGDLDMAAEMWQSYSRLLILLNNIGTDDHKITLPIIEDAMIPLTDITSFIASAHALAKKHRLTLLFWAHLTTGVIHVRPFLNLRNLSDKQKIAKLIHDYYELVIKTDGSVAGEYGEGRLRARSASEQFSSEEKELFSSVKNIFDSHGIFNPGVKFPSEKDPLSALDESYSH